MSSVANYIGTQDWVTLAVEAGLLIAAAAGAFLAAVRLRHHKERSMRERAWRSRVDLRSRGA